MPLHNSTNSSSLPAVDFRLHCTLFWKTGKEKVPGWGFQCPPRVGHNANFFVSTIRDQEFGYGLGFPGPGASRVFRLHAGNFKPLEDRAGLGVVVVDPGFLLPG